jgi:RNA polymerase sigma-70 factor (ECF subfamily)
LRIQKYNEHQPKDGAKYLNKRPDSLVARLRRGEHTAATELVDRYYRQIYIFMRRLGHDYQASEDLTQETFLRAWSHVGQLRNGKALEGWLYRIAGNVARLQWRKRKGKHLSSIERIEVPGRDEAASDKAGKNEQLGRLDEAVGKLPWKLRQAIVLHYMQHLTIAEAAEAVGVREGTFKSRLNRALNRLRKRIG